MDIRRRLFRSQVANDNGMMPEPNKERSSRRVADTQRKEYNLLFQRMLDIFRSKRVAPSPPLNGSDRSRTSKKGDFVDNGTPFLLNELPHSTSRISKRNPLLDRDIEQKEIEGMRNILNILDSSPKSLNHLTLIKYLNGRFDLSGITEIKLYGKDLSNIDIDKEEIIRLLKSTLQQSNNIETIEIDVPYLIPVILELKTDKLSTIKRLILRSYYEYGTPKPISDDDIFNLLSMIGKMTNLEVLEFSQFEMDVGNLQLNGDLFNLFFKIVSLKKLKSITFVDNIFNDSKKESALKKFYSDYEEKKDEDDKFTILIKWMIDNPKEFTYHLNAYEVFISSDYWKKYSQQKKRNEIEKIPDDYNEKQALLKKRRDNLPKISDVIFEDFLKDKEAVEEWLKWLINNNNEIKSIDNIVERLHIVIKYLKYLEYDIMNFFEENPELKRNIKTEFELKQLAYHPNEEYNSIIKKIIKDNGKKLIVRSQGGRKAAKKPPKETKKPPKEPKKPPKEHKKPPKEPKKPPKEPKKQPKETKKPPKEPKKQPKVVPKKQPKVVPTKPTKQPTKPTTVARKANKKK